MEPARAVPPYEREQVATAWYYCLLCRHSQATEYAIRQHIRVAHEKEDAYSGEEYTNGTHLRILLQRWDEWSLSVIESFERQVESLRGADDLALDVGEGVPELPHPKLPKVLKKHIPGKPGFVPPQEPLYEGDDGA